MTRCESLHRIRCTHGNDSVQDMPSTRKQERCNTGSGIKRSSRSYLARDGQETTMTPQGDLSYQSQGIHTNIDIPNISSFTGGSLSRLSVLQLILSSTTKSARVQNSGKSYRSTKLGSRQVKNSLAASIPGNTFITPQVRYANEGFQIQETFAWHVPKCVHLS